MKFTYKLTGIKGSVVYTDFLNDELTVDIKAEKISDATDKVRQYLADNYLKCDKTILVKIEFEK